MPDKIDLTWEDCRARANQVARHIERNFPRAVELGVYAVPRGGIPAALLVLAEMAGLKRPIALEMVDEPRPGSIIVDDIIDTGATKARFKSNPFFALVDKQAEGKWDVMPWVTFPWERSGGEKEGPAENIRRLLEFIGDDPMRDGLRGTPDRVLKSYGELFSGYKKDPADVMRTFELGSYSQMVVLKDIEFTSTCEHHMLPFIGSAHLAYLPNGKVIGISKLVRLLEIFSRRLQIQERICDQVVAALMEHLQPLGAACVLEASHHCMVCRGVQKQHSVMITSSLAGVFKEPSVKAEFFAMIGK